MSEFVLRDARYSELPEIAHVMGRAFWDDNLFGEYIHPHRQQFPNDIDLYFLRRARVNFWDWRFKFLVAVAKNEDGREVIAGIAQWCRLGDGGKHLDLWRIDPRMYNTCPNFLFNFIPFFTVCSPSFISLLLLYFICFEKHRN